MKVTELIHELSKHYGNEIVTIGIYDDDGLRESRYLIDSVIVKDCAVEITITKSKSLNDD